MVFLGQQYGEDPPDEPAWWASFNVVLAMSSRRQTEHQADASVATSSVWEYASNAMDVVLDVMMRNISLQSVQALLGLAWFYFGTSNPQPSYMLSSTALRLAYAIGLHNPDSDLLSRPMEKELKQRVFWIAVMMDHQASFRTGRPLAHMPNDYKIALPSACGDSRLSTVANKHSAVASHLFGSNAQLSLIEMDIFQKLYSPSIATSMNDQAVNLQELDRTLQTWWTNVPPLSRSDLSVDVEGANIQLDLLRLHMRYHHCTILISRVHGLPDYWAPQAYMFVADTSPVLRTSIEKCVDAAKAIARLLEIVPEREDSFLW
jgi:hypothetical protein